MGVGRGSKRARWWVLSAALLYGLAIASPAVAQSDEARSGARAAATEGAQAFTEHRWADAIDLFTRAESLVHSPVHLLYMARSFEKLNALVKAREAYIKIANEDLPANSPQPFKDAKANAQKELEALDPRMPYVSVVVQGAGPKPVIVTMDAVQVPPALLGVPRPVDPGDHRFEATAEGMDSAVSSVAVREGRSETVVLTLHASANAVPEAVAPATPTAPLAVSPTPLVPTAPPPEADQSHPLPPLMWVGFGVGAVGLGLGTVFALQAKSKTDDGNGKCDQAGPDGQKNWCNASEGAAASSLYGDARTDRTIAIVGFVAGGIGVATGVTMLILASQHKKETAGVVPWVGLGSAGMSGRF
ncbi:MAG TPA: hypothetical protein VH142_13875 [Polyangiaceae bacterium]|jgi:hypothetical protein|nr:hypothetical protein [Polyangiaceae bacterium]